MLLFFRSRESSVKDLLPSGRTKRATQRATWPMLPFLLPSGRTQRATFRATWPINLVDKNVDTSKAVLSSILSISAESTRMQTLQGCFCRHFRRQQNRLLIFLSRARKRQYQSTTPPLLFPRSLAERNVSAFFYNLLSFR